MARERADRDLMLLVSGNAVSALGNAVYIITVTLLLKELTQSAFALGLFQFVALSPGFLLSPIIGAVVDRVPRLRVIVLADLFRGILMIVAGLLLLFPALRHPWFVLFVALLAGLGHAFFVPAAQALLPAIVPAGRLPRATTLRAAGSQLANLAGNAAGGALYLALGAPLIFVANGVSFVLSALQEQLIRSGRDQPRTNDGRRGALLRSAREGIRVAAADPALRRVIVSQAGLYALSPVLLLALPFVVIDDLGLSESSLGLFFALALSGGIVAFLALRVMAPKRLLALPVVSGSYLLLGAAFLLVTLHVSAASIALVALMSGAAAAAVYLYATTWVQVRSGQNLHGRLFALLEAANSLVAPLAYLISGALLTALGGEQRGLLFVAVAVVALLWGGFCLLRPQ